MMHFIALILKFIIDVYVAYRATWILIPTVMLSYTVSASIEEIPLPSDIQSCFESQYQKGNLTTHIGEKLLWHCVHGSLWTRVGANETATMPQSAVKWFADLLYTSYREADNRKRVRRQALRHRQVPQLRIRREYRVISDTERRLFHRAINMLKADRSIPPNRFDALGRLHELLGERAHDGPNFLGWHRFFLILCENALREKVPTITIPYWDSTLDSQLVDPRASLIWTPEFMGNGNGRIRTGPFTGWSTPYGPLMRNFGDGGTMMNWTSIRDTFSMNHLAEITHPQAHPKANIEDHHGEPHLWVGGHMSPQALAGYDPIFLLHHSFIDLIWELFRRIQRRRGIDPTTDYPSNNTGPPGHQLNDPSGFGNLLNRDSLSDIFTTEMYTYQLPPTCSTERPTCDSPYIHCNTSGTRPKCVAASIFDTPPDQIFNVDNLVPLRKKRDVLLGATYSHNDSHLSEYFEVLDIASEVKCTPENINDHYENNFNIDGATNPKLWSYLPVNVVVKQKTESGNGTMKQHAAVYPKCNRENQLPVNVYIESNGLSYRGMFKDIVHIQKDLMVSSVMTYIGVRSPDRTPSEFLISAYDSCGRVCTTFCKTHGSYRPCSGALRADMKLPHMFGENVTVVSKSHWEYSQYGVPVLDESEIFIKVLCGDGLHWPWYDNNNITNS